MTFSPTLTDAIDASPFNWTTSCLCCGEAIEGPTVGYDLCLPGGDSTITRAMMHRDCAFAMAQRIICDAWPNRRVGQQMVTNVP
jgi:hypothetical protein